tara:strand:- start:474 stop:680 length:207 start_codon:yes stop_codon:yes gene_type:complete
MVKLVLSDGDQTLTKVCNTCGCHLGDLTVEDIMVKSNTSLIIKNKDGNEITRTKLPDSICNCECEDCE